MAKVATSEAAKAAAADKEVAGATAKVATEQQTVDKINEELAVARTPKSAAIEKKEPAKKEPTQKENR